MPLIFHIPRKSSSREVVTLITTLSLVGGLAIFFLGLRAISAGMKGLFQQDLQRRLTAAPASHKHWPTFLLATLFTALVQSSSAVTIIGVCLAEIGLISVAEALALTLGANVGTTITGQLISISLRASITWFLGLGLLLLLIALANTVRRQQLLYTGMALCGLGLLFSGFELLQYALKTGVVSSSLTQNLLDWARHGPWEGFWSGLVSTGLVQSSSLVIVATISLLNNGLITFQAAFYAMLGSNIGTSVTTLLAGFGGNKVAKSAALANLFFNIISVLMIIPFANLLSTIAQWSSPYPGRQLANAHTIFNLVTALALLPFCPILAGVLERIANLLET